ncbi:hypothetical protein F441_22873 [Phytophthora nicotianae CJ01A1]|uniref:Uncharacterized protein n=1 Tax=Phytophthora nicotianae CJ01A1 TaxID=1317063 RepID=W2VQQ1_PHYNI|nr:hypothetical protein F441_22873 [Phytophthora nicotianae CJ01A1]
MGSTSWSELNSPVDLPDADDSRRPPRERKGPIPYRMGANMGARNKPSLRRTPHAVVVGRGTGAAMPAIKPEARRALVALLRPSEEFVE